MIRRYQVPGLVLTACPSFAERWETSLVENAWGRTRLYYIDAGDLVRHIVHLRLVNQTDEFDAVFDLIERLIVKGDDYVANLGVIGYVEGFQMCTVTSAGLDPETHFRPLLGPVSTEYWHRLNKLWNAAAIAAERAER